MTLPADTDSHSPALRIGDLVVAVREISEEGIDGKKLLHARPGMMGEVIQLNQGHWPTVRWESTVCDCIPTYEIEPIFGFDLTYGRPARG